MPVSLPKTFSQTGASAVPDQWWTAFGDEQLNGLTHQALRDNFSLQMAWDRLDQARALARAARADLSPSLTATAGAARTVTKTRGTNRAYATVFALGLSASYEVDLWGRVRSLREAARLDTAATREDLHAAAMTLTAEVASTWYQLIEQRAHLKLLDAQVRTSEDYLDIITLKFRRGQAPAADVLQQRQQLEAIRGKRVKVASDEETLRHRLAVLLGRAPGTFTPPVGDELPPRPPLPESGLPAALMQRRPDVRAAYLRVHSADQRVAAAIADRFPKLSLTADADTTADTVRDLFDNWVAAVAANLVAPLLDGGARAAEVQRSRAAASEYFHGYGQAVLEAVEEVANAMTREARQQEYVESLRRQIKLSRQSTDQTRDNYTKGTMDFTRFLTTLIAHYELERTYVQARRELVQFRINLYKALGGGWRLRRGEFTATRSTQGDQAANAPARPGDLENLDKKGANDGRKP